MSQTQQWCPSCNQFFGEPGFCPFDGSRLTAPPEQISGPVAQPITMRAVSATGNDGSAALAAYKQPPKNEYERLVGQTLDGRYYIERKIGEGGMGVVFAAKHSVIEKPLAVKVLKREVARDSATIKRFVQEAKAASRIGHPNIVDVTDFGTTPDGMTYSVMEYVDGTTLSSALKRSAPLSLQRALPIIAQLCRALGAAHDKGIVHRDLKPENIFLVNRDGRRDFVKIVDFGIAKVTPVDGQPLDGPRLTRAGAVFGTPEYMAPEQAAGRPDTDQRVDIYALTTILYEMLTGKVPHKSDSMVRTLAMQMLDPVIPPSQLRPDLPISPELERVVMQGLAKKREQRYGSMADLLLDLERACPGVSSKIPTTSGDGPMQLVPAPPGADVAAMSGQRTIDDEPRGWRSKRPSTGAPPRSKRPSTAGGGVSTMDVPTQQAEGPRATRKRVANEPEFMTSQRPLTFEHVFEDEAAAPRARSKWPLVIAMLLIAAGGGIGIALALRGSASDQQASNPPSTIDAAVDRPVADAAAPAPADATVVVEVTADAAVPIDAGRSGHGKRDAGAAVRVDAGIRIPKDRLTPRGNVIVEVFTKPDGGTLYINNSYKGPSGTNIEEAPGTKVRVKCTLPGYDPGFVDIVFDAEVDVVMCRPIRPKRCVGALHNPFDDCPDPEPPE